MPLSEYPALDCCNHSEHISSPLSLSLSLSLSYTRTNPHFYVGEEIKRGWSGGGGGDGGVSLFCAWGEFQHALPAQRVVAESCCEPQWDAR